MAFDFGTIGSSWVLSFVEQQSVQHRWTVIPRMDPSTFPSHMAHFRGVVIRAVVMQSLEEIEATGRKWIFDRFDGAVARYEICPSQGNASYTLDVCQRAL